MSVYSDHSLMGELVDAIAEMSAVDDVPLDTDEDKNFKLICEKDIYIMSRKALARQSPYFEIVCNVGKAAEKNRLTLHRNRRDDVRALLHFFKCGVYDGPKKHPGSNPPDYELNNNRSAGEENGITLELRSNDPAVLVHFPEFEDNSLIDGDIAIKACKIITNHELFQKNNQYAFQCIEFSYYRCHLDLLPPPIQLELYLFFGHLKTRDPAFSSDAVFHARMFKTALKYMVAEIKPHIAHAFRHGVKPWVNTSLFPETSFLKAVEIIWKPKFPVEDGKDDELVQALCKVMAENWGWMKHDDDVRVFMMDEKYEALYHAVVQVAGDRCRKWEERLRAFY